MERRVISTPQAPSAIGPYSQAIAAGDLIFCSGQIPLDPATGKLVEGDIRSQTRRVLQNLAAVLQAEGSALERIVKTTVYMVNLDDFKAMNETYAEFFAGAPPARATVQVSGLPAGAQIEIEAIAARA
ncbi:MAG: RidA family protein [Rudaea sp.]